MKYTKEVHVLYADTDSYKVVWHGSYLKWFEEGRCSLCDMAGVNLQEIENLGLSFPVVDLHLRYKAPARLFDDITIETTISELKSRTVTFKQIIKNKQTQTTLVTAEVVVVAISSGEMKLIKMPDDIYTAFLKALCLQL